MTDLSKLVAEFQQYLEKSSNLDQPNSNWTGSSGNRLFSWTTNYHVITVLLQPKNQKKDHTSQIYLFITNKGVGKAEQYSFDTIEELFNELKTKL